jgi:SAM-dependent methyltransferase
MNKKNYLNKSIVKVNLGCGEKWVHGWINIDWSWNARIRKHPITKPFVPLLRFFGLIDTSINWPPDLILHDIRKKLPFKDNSVDFIYTAHVIEHLKKYECINCLKECYRILKKDGIIRIVTPDLQFFALKYIERDQKFYYEQFRYQISDADKFADRFLSIIYDKKNKEPQSIKEKIKSFLFPIPYHMWLYDFESLSAILHEIGFRNIERCAFRKGRVPDLDKLEEPAPENLYIEAQK